MSGPGDPVRVDSRKYGGGPHKRWTAFRLGEDEHGVWIGAPAGTAVTTPGGDYVLAEDSVRVVPHRAWWSASFAVPPAPVAVYVDMCMPSRWEADTLHMVDLDLDVILPSGAGAAPFLDDEDEFDAHRVRWAYPPEVVEGARRSAQDVLTGLTIGAEPFASAYRGWLSALAARREA